MTQPPRWFIVVAAMALLWNLAGLAAVIADLLLSAEDVAALSEPQQAMYKARPLWSVAASLVAVVAGTLGCLGLLLRKRWALWLLCASLVGVVLQDIGLFGIAGALTVADPVPMVLQGIVLIIAAALVVLARRAAAKSWLS